MSKINRSYYTNNKSLYEKMNPAGSPRISMAQRDRMISIAAVHPIYYRRSNNESLHECRSARHDYHVMMVYTEGRASLWMNSELQCEPGDIMLIPAGMLHRMREAAANTLATGVGFFAGPDLSASSAENLLAPYDRVRSGGLPIGKVPAERQAFFETLFRELERETKSLEPQGGAAARHLLALLLVETHRIFQKLHDTATPPPTDVVSRALRFIEDNCLRSISLGDVADAVGRSPAHLTTAVRGATGKPVLAWILAGRMHEARRRLLYTGESVETIAEHVGYADPTHFTRLFRREFGTTPAAWRKGLRAGKFAESKDAPVKSKAPLRAKPLKIV
ncbi:MAG: AraC family transcriptional regulator [Leptospirales bacterium]|jgi:AraC family transcriptional activator of pobA